MTQITTFSYPPGQTGTSEASDHGVGRLTYLSSGYKVMIPVKNVKTKFPSLLIRKEGNGLFNDALNTFYLRFYGVGHMVTVIKIAREETRCRHMD